MKKKKVNKVFRKFLSGRNLQVTPQRQLILDEFIEARQHVSVEELYDLVKMKEKSIGQVTVFRTLKLLVEADVAQAVNFGDKVVRYEINCGAEHHDHLVCLRCGAVIEAMDEELEAIQNRLCEKFNFIAVNHRLEIFGTCSNCQ